MPDGYMWDFWMFQSTWLRPIFVFQNSEGGGAKPVVYGQGDATRLLSEERRRLWKAAVRRQDIVTEAEGESPECQCFHTSLYRHPNP